HRNIKDLSQHSPDQLALRMTNLIMQATQHISPRKRVVILDKFIHNPQFGHGLFVVAFQKKPAAVCEYRGLEQQNSGERSLRDRIQPSHAAAHHNNFQLTAPEIFPVYVRDLQLSAYGWLKRTCNLDDLVIVEIQPSHRVPRLWSFWFFLETKRLAVAVEFNHPVPLRIVDRIGKHARSLGLGTCLRHTLGEVMAVENVVAEHQCATGGTDEVSAYQESLRDSFRTGLSRILQIESQNCAISQEQFESGQIFWSRDDQDVPDSRQHERGKRVVDHRLVVDRQQALANRVSHRIEPRDS